MLTSFLATPRPLPRANRRCATSHRQQRFRMNQPESAAETLRSSAVAVSTASATLHEFGTVLYPEKSHVAGLENTLAYVQLPTDAIVRSKHIYDCCSRLSRTNFSSSEIDSRLLLPGSSNDGELELLGRLEWWHWQRPCDLCTLMNDQFKLSTRYSLEGSCGNRYEHEGACSDLTSTLLFPTPWQ